ncbi:MAG: FtsX-like permease family protein, partial [Cyclobacteriaceae bacterium]
AVGHQFTPFGQGRKQPVTAVVENFNFMSLHHQIAPLVLVISDDFALNQLSVKVAGQDFSSGLASIEKSYQKVMGDIPFEFSFMDDYINKLYESETRVKGIVNSLTIIAVLFALFGVYGLISFNIENKTKEIAIRKVLGVAPKELLVLFSKTYYKLMIIAFVISIPITWKVMNEWLSNFSYKVTVSPAWFAITFLVVMISISAIGLIKYYSLREINPADALKNN